jgi:ABC-2 type transport system permease protein
VPSQGVRQPRGCQRRVVHDLWKRLRSAPVSRCVILAGKAASGTIVSLSSLLVSFAFAIVVLGARIEGSVIGFAAVCIA